MEDIYHEVVGALEAGEAVCMATIVATRGATPRSAGAKMLVRADGTILGTIGGGAMEGQAIADAQEAIRLGRSSLQHYSLHGQDAASLGICGGEADVFLEVIRPQQTLVIVGGGHIALYLAQFAPPLGFRTVVVDDRPEFCNPDRFPAADETIVATPDEMLQSLRIGEGTCVVIATSGHEHDARALELVLSTGANYIGMVGSRKKIASVFEELRGHGITDADLTRVYTPIGLDIGSETPSEIALSIMAEIFLALKGGNGRPLREKVNPLQRRERLDG